MMMMGDYYHMNSSSASGMMFSVNSGVVNNCSGYAQFGNLCASVVSNSVPGLMHDAGLAVDWSVEEQYKLEEGISIYAHEPTIMKYIKIAATLRDKTVRDVAMRCRWMASKRKKQDELKLGRKFGDKMDELSSNSPMDVVPFTATTNNQIHSVGIPLEALSVSTERLLEQNRQVLGQISANISVLRLQENVNLFGHVKNNITDIINKRRCIPGPPLPVSLNKDLVNTIPPITSQTMMTGSTGRMQVKQEPDY